MLFSKALSLSEMEGIYHATYRPGTVDVPTAGAVDASKLPRSLIGFWSSLRLSFRCLSLNVLVAERACR